MTTVEKVRAFVVQNFYVTNSDDLCNTTSLRDSGIIDSTGVLELITFIEGEFGINIDDHEIVPANLDSIDSIDSYVRRKLE